MTTETSDFYSADIVEIMIDADETKVWVDVNGRNVFRAYRIKRLALNDHRQPSPTPKEPA